MTRREIPQAMRLVRCPSCNKHFLHQSAERFRCVNCTTPVGEWGPVEGGMVRRDHAGRVVERRTASSGRAGYRRGASGGLAPELTPCVEQHPKGKTSTQRSRDARARRDAA